MLCLDSDVEKSIILGFDRWDPEWPGDRKLVAKRRMAFQMCSVPQPSTDVVTPSGVWKTQLVKYVLCTRPGWRFPRQLDMVNVKRLETGTIEHPLSTIKTFRA